MPYDIPFLYLVQFFQLKIGDDDSMHTLTAYSKCERIISLYRATRL